MRVAVAYAEASRQMVQELDMADGSTAQDLIQRSGILAKFPQIDLGVNKVGIFGKLIALDTVLNDGDRVEIYRPAMGKPPKKERGAKATTEEDTE
ncbi:MAG: RnfH family protein [Magnetococcales bacterium]|nr:RnfH family protein [Magnetococcales bacterium]NGZ29066.1 RnfH family protein [Magnetococcales bacterium]